MRALALACAPRSPSLKQERRSRIGRDRRISNLRETSRKRHFLNTMVLLKMLSATVSVLGDATWRPLLLFVYCWTAYAGWNTFGLGGLIIAMILPGISQVICVLYLWEGNVAILQNYDWALLCAVVAWMASFCGNALWNWIELRSIELSLSAAKASRPMQEFPLREIPGQPISAQTGEVA